MSHFKDTCAIAGVGETKFGKLPGASTVGVNIEACLKAVEDAGLKPSDVDGLISQQPYRLPMFLFSTWLSKRMGLPVRYSTDVDLGGASPVGMVHLAVMAINAGLANNVLCTFGEASGRPAAPPKDAGAKPAAKPPPPSGGGGPARGAGGTSPEEFEHPFGQLAPMHGYALACQRHMYEFGTTSRHLGAIAVACRKHASMNDNAQQRKPMTMDDYFASPIYCEPFRLFDLCQVSDGGAAVLVTSAERARNLKHKPVYISGMGTGCSGRGIAFASSLTTSSAAVSSKTAYAMAGMKPQDMAFAELYDCFTYTVLVSLEDYGFCKKGEGGPFCEGGRIELGGQLPVNTHGGLLSQGHIDGMNHITEAVKQLRGDCGPRQVKDAEIGLVSGNGGTLSTHGTLILRR